MSYWKEAKIKEFAEVKGGKRLPIGRQLITQPNSHPYIRIRDLGNSKYLQLTSDYLYVDDKTQKTIAHYIVNKGDILISVVGTIGLVGIVGETLDGANQTENCDKIINITKVLSEYLYYYLISGLGQDEIKKGTVGAVQPKLPLKNVLDISVKYPPLEAQNKIVKILSSLDDKIELNNAINNNLEQQASLLYSHFFEEIPSDKLKKGYLSEIAEVTSGKRPPMKSALCTNETSIPIVGAAAIMGYTNTFNHNDKILVIGRVGTHGIVQRLNAPCWTSDNTLVITSHYYEYLYQILKRIDYHALNRGSTQPLITQGDINKVPVIIPDDNILTEYETLAGSLMSKYEANVIENAKLANVRDTLLPRLMSGELDVSDIDL